MNTELLKSKLLEAAFNGSLTHADTSTWERYTLGEIFSMKAGKFIAASQIFEEQSEDNPYPCYGGNDIRGYVKDYNTEGDFPIIGRQGALCGNVKYASGKFYATEHAVVVQNIKRVDSKWAFYALTFLNLNQYATSTAQPGLSVKKIEQVLLSLPPLAGQQEIVSTLEEGFAAIDAIAEAKENLFSTAEMLRSKILKAVFDGSLIGVETSNWAHKRLLDACDVYQPATISTKELVKDGEYDVFGANGKIGKYTRYNHEESEVLLTCRGATCGSVNISTPKSWINGNAMVVHPKNNDLSKDFIYYLLHSLDFLQVITGAAQPQITRTSLTKIDISYPPLAEQQRIVAKIEELFAEIDKLTK